MEIGNCSASSPVSDSFELSQHNPVTVWRATQTAKAVWIHTGGFSHSPHFPITSLQDGIVGF